MDKHCYENTIENNRDILEGIENHGKKYLLGKGHLEEYCRIKTKIEELEIKQTPENLKKMKIGRLLATKIIHSWELKDYFDDILWKDDEFADAQEAIAKIIANTNLTYLTNLQQ